jgi:hypothetical protein
MAYAPSAIAARDLAQIRKPRRNWLLRVIDAIERANMRRAEREIERFLGGSGAKLTDESEREIERRFLSQK